MPGLNSAGINSALDHVGTLITHISIHSAAPATGGNEIGTRQAITWNAAAAGNLNSVGTQQFAVTAGQTVAAVGFWNALSAGTQYGSKTLAAAETFSNNGTFTVNDLDINLT